MNDRGSGRTSAAMLEAPQGAIYVWCNSNTDYALRLAHHLGRSDLMIVPPDDVQRAARGVRRIVVVDHAFYAFPKGTYDVIIDFASAQNARLLT